jgi:hypothetical protein
MVQRNKDPLESFIKKQLKAQKIEPKSKSKPKTTMEHLESWNGKSGEKVGGRGFLGG